MTREIDESEVEWLDPEELIELERDDVDEDATTRRISGIRAKREELTERAEEALRAIREEARIELAAVHMPRTTPITAEADERVIDLGPSLRKQADGNAEAQSASSGWALPLFGWLVTAIRLAVFFMIGVAIGSFVAMALVELLGPRAPRGESLPGTSEVAPSEVLRGERGGLPDIGKPSDAF